MAASFTPPLELVPESVPLLLWPLVPLELVVPDEDPGGGRVPEEELAAPDELSSFAVWGSVPSGVVSGVANRSVLLAPLQAAIAMPMNEAEGTRKRRSSIEPDK
ncbi:MAG TPA: hypothetical protein VM925_02170 [Labilithrix sp.]|nr:hypothetical protein [Labilithrix sp.]